MSLKVRLAIAVASAVAVAIAIAAGATWWLTSEALRGPIDAGLQIAAEQADERVRSRPAFGREARRGVGPASEANPFHFQLINGSGSAILEDGMPIDDVDRAVARGNQATTLRTVEIVQVSVDSGDTVETRFRALTVRASNGGAIKFARDISDIDDALVQLRNRLAIAAVLGVVAAATFGWLFARRITRPISAVTEAAGQLAELDSLPGRVPVESNDEVGQLAQSFNRLIGALEVSREQQRRLVADASHELRTPLASLRMKIELLQQRPDLATDQRQRVLDGSVDEVEALSDLVAELVDLAADPNATAEEPSDLDLGHLVNEVVTKARRRTGRTIELVSDASHVHARPSALTRAISNLVDNAVKYSPDESTIEVSVRDGSVQVRDHGPGIDPADREFVFDRFFRSAKARTRPGSGLGLAIVKQVAENHDGAVWVDEPSDAGGGAVVGLRLPVAASK